MCGVSVHLKHRNDVQIVTTKHKCCFSFLSISFSKMCLKSFNFGSVTGFRVCKWKRIFIKWEKTTLKPLPQFMPFISIDFDWTLCNEKRIEKFLNHKKYKIRLQRNFDLNSILFFPFFATKNKSERKLYCILKVNGWQKKHKWFFA